MEPVITGAPKKEPGIDTGDIEMFGAYPDADEKDSDEDVDQPTKKARSAAGDQLALEDGVKVVAGASEGVEPPEQTAMPVNPFTEAQIQAAGGKEPVELLRVDPYTLWGLGAKVYVSGTPGLALNHVLFRCTKGRVASVDTVKKDHPDLNVEESTVVVKVTSTALIGYQATVGGPVSVLTFEVAWRKALQATQNQCKLYSMLTCNIKEHLNANRCSVTSKQSLVWLPKPEAREVRGLLGFDFFPGTCNVPGTT